ncbi:MAG: sugar ABC transporter substrate-binding protein [Burkholderiales bacterium]|nr:sugar ABC transporter substrate-binding protein [Burkholderiales bacterium]
MRRFRLLLLVVAGSILLLAAVMAIAAEPPVVTIRHALWDASQKPLYQQCATDFERGHPGIRIRIRQQGWDDYWTTLSTGFVASTAPDVFADHLSQFPEQVDNGVLLDIAPLVARDHVATDIYEDGLYANWGRGRAQYALPADWDTVALAVNLDLARAAGITVDELRNLNWNPRDGGSFGRVAARLTRDAAGHDALSPAFDRSQVVVRGYQTAGSGGMMGQSEWSHFAVSDGFTFQDGPWRAPLHYDAPALAQTLDWLVSLSASGVSATPEQLGRLGAEAMFASGRVAMIAVGSWMVGYFRREAHFHYTFVPLPIGPLGYRATMRNGLAHAIWSGTPHPEQAWQWLRYLGSPACQSVVAAGGVVYPALRGAGQVAAAAQRRAGSDPEAFFEMAAAHTFPPPIISHAPQIKDLIANAIDAVLLGRARAQAPLARANAQANELLKAAPP